MTSSEIQHRWNASQVKRFAKSRRFRSARAPYSTFASSPHAPTLPPLCSCSLPSRDFLLHPGVQSIPQTRSVAEEKQELEPNEERREGESLHEGGHANVSSTLKAGKSFQVQGCTYLPEAVHQRRLPLFQNRVAGVYLHVPAEDVNRRRPAEGVGHLRRETNISKSQSRRRRTHARAGLTSIKGVGQRTDGRKTLTFRIRKIGLGAWAGSAFLSPSTNPPTPSHHGTRDSPGW